MKDSCHCLIIWENKILLFHRDNILTIRHPDCWTLPGGGIEENETPLSAIQRELVEEAGYSPSNLDYIGTKESPDARKWYLFSAFIDAAEAKLFKKGIEGQGVGFFTIKDALNLNLSPLLRLNLTNLKAELQNFMKRKTISKNLTQPISFPPNFKWTNPYK